MDHSDYCRTLRTMRDPTVDIDVRMQAAFDALDFETDIQKRTHEAHIQYLHPAKIEAEIARNARIAWVARKWLGHPDQPVPALPDQLIKVVGGLPPLPGTDVIMPILP
jgi:hypothetical protein